MDLTGQLREDWCIEVHLAQKRTKLYVVPGIEESFPFHPRVRKVCTRNIAQWYELVVRASSEGCNLRKLGVHHLYVVLTMELSGRHWADIGPAWLAAVTAYRCCIMQLL